jgi:tetratricopeptide (TPR) repeat protein
MFRRVSGLLAFVSVLAAAAPCRAADQWLEIKSPHFTVVSNAGQGAARNLAWQMEQIRSAVGAIWPWAHLDLDRPFIVLGAKDEQSMRALTPRYWEEKGSMHPVSVWVEGADRYYLAVRTDVKGEDYRNLNPYQTSYFSYVTLVLRQSVVKPLPFWLERGLAAVLSNTVVTDKQVLVGPPIPRYISQLRDGPRLRVGELVSMAPHSPALRGDDAAWRFDVEAWALVHLLWFGDQGAHAGALQHFLDAVLAGTDAGNAFREALGAPDAWESALSVYVSRNIFSFQQLQVDATAKREAFPARPLEVPESASVRALFHVAMNRPADARAAIDEARKAGSAPGSYEAEAELLDREGKHDDAVAAYQRAVDGGASSAYAYRRLASLLWRRSGNPSHDDMMQIASLLGKATGLNTRDDYAYAMLGEARSILGEKDGLGLVRRAISLAPQEADHHLTAARVLARERNFDGAQKEVEAAVALARTDDERQRGRELAQWLQTARGPGRS